MSRVEKKVQTRQRILDAAGRSFRKAGFGGIGVDGLARNAGVTSGAFYVHFDSKSAAFRESVQQGMHELQQGVLYFQSRHGAAWWPEFVQFYLGFKRTCDLTESCALQSLAPEIGRLDGEARAEFETGLRHVAEAILAGPHSPKLPRDLDATLVALASLIGAVTLARAVGSEALSGQIADATGRALLGSHWPSDANEDGP
ncbi:TetR/AcrR family transcriptional regulator [Duganella fentianensis]|uniref:TetR/AcrR family transcriptional regulator n=1 Tax=Duganella fentianensis TaxID=2692177 RepID=UPI003530962A